MKNKIAVVLVSGGMDSALSAAYANKKYGLAFLHFNYGQRTQKRELKAFHDIADFYRAKQRLCIDLGHLKIIGGSSITDKRIKILKANLHRKNIPSTYVPFRNATMLSIAVSWAEMIKAEKIYIGAVEEDSSGYPDCREIFYKSFNKVIRYGTKTGQKLKIETPLIHMTKKEIVLNSIKLKSPIHLTWSCYKNNNFACGVCDSCSFRLRGYKQAGISDPIPYKKC